MRLIDGFLSFRELILVGLGCGWLATLPSAAVAASVSRGRVTIADATFTPQYGPGGSKLPVKIGRFAIDRVPVTRARFALFVKANPAWARGKVDISLAETGYLSGWKGSRFPTGTAFLPVVHVSYFAASAHCEWQGGRLPTVMEWEYVASAGKRSADGTKDPDQVADWIKSYSEHGPLRAVGSERANFHGVSDLHGLIWEWTSDYNSSFVSSDNRQDGELSQNLFCGTGSVGAADRANYPAFMRYAMRGGLRPNYTVANLGFRCAYDIL